MAHTPLITDRTALALARERAETGDSAAWFIHDEAISLLSERLKEVNRSFNHPAIIGPRAEIWADALGLNAEIVADNDVLALKEGQHDLVIHALCLHWANDPVGQLIQMRRALKPDGFMIAIMFGGQTLASLRSALAEAEAAVTGGISPRILPMSDIRTLGGLLQRAEFALPVADSVSLDIRYRKLNTLYRDLRGMAERNVLNDRLRHPTARKVFSLAEEIYTKTFSDPDGLLLAEFELMFLSGWAPDASQPKPLRPGSAAQRLADFLETEEHNPEAR